MIILKRKTSDISDALYSAEIDAKLLAVNKEGNLLPYCTQVFLSPNIVEDYFNIIESSKYLVRLYIFDNEKEHRRFLSENMMAEGPLKGTIMTNRNIINN